MGIELFFSIREGFYGHLLTFFHANLRTFWYIAFFSFPLSSFLINCFWARDTGLFAPFLVKKYLWNLALRLYYTPGPVSMFCFSPSTPPPLSTSCLPSRTRSGGWHILFLHDIIHGFAIILPSLLCTWKVGLLDCVFFPTFGRGGAGRYANDGLC